MIKNRGGFPPIKYCDNYEKKIDSKDFKKERLFSPKINIKKILNNKPTKLIIDLENKNDTLDIVNEL